MANTYTNFLKLWKISVATDIPDEDPFTIIKLYDAAIAVGLKAMKDEVPLSANYKQLGTAINAGLVRLAALKRSTTATATTAAATTATAATAAAAVNDEAALKLEQALLRVISLEGHLEESAEEHVNLEKERETLKQQLDEVNEELEDSQDLNSDLVLFQNGLQTKIDDLNQQIRDQERSRE